MTRSHEYEESVDRIILVLEALYRLSRLRGLYLHT
jgi:hypothetical protein